MYPPPVALQAPSVSTAARATPAAPIRRAMRRRGAFFTIVSCMSIPRFSGRTTAYVRGLAMANWPRAGARGTGIQVACKVRIRVSRCGQATRIVGHYALAERPRPITWPPSEWRTKADLRRRIPDRRRGCVRFWAANVGLADEPKRTRTGPSEGILAAQRRSKARARAPPQYPVSASYSLVHLNRLPPSISHPGCRPA